ncbi:MAG: succinate dehydrogenase flavoprotein subunit [Planctomycetota bacterium]|nr:succinate dehydrogenase flavoprotein subunit [Planctomycetota bacterium]
MPSGSQRVIVVGGGLAGLAGAARIAEAGLAVDLFSLVPVKRSHSVCAQGGINACNEVSRQQGYSEYEHFDETIYGGDFLAHQPPVYEMAHWAPKIIDLLDRAGVPFNRTSEGQRDLRLFGGSLYKRTHFAGATTGQQLLYALDEQVRRYEFEGKVNKFEHWEFLRPVVDEAGVCQGIVAQDLRSMQVRAFRADAVVMATGGCGLVFGKSTNSVMCTGAAAARCYIHGVKYANGEFIQVHPTAIPGADKLRLMSESARGEGGRVWVPAVKGPDGAWRPHPDPARDPRQLPEAERWYFLEEKYPAYGNIVPRDIATREIFNICLQGFGVGGGRMVYLDLSFKPREELERKLGGIIEIYRKFVGEDPCELPMKIFPGVHYSMGGLWTTYTPGRDYARVVSGELSVSAKGGWDPDARPQVGLEKGAPNNMMTNITGLYAFGEVNYQYHGANRLGANALLSCIFDGLFCGVSVANYVRDRSAKPASAAPPQMFDAAVADEEARASRLISSRGGENPYVIGVELGDMMTDASTVVKTGPRLHAALNKLDELRDRFARVSLSDTGAWTNQNLAWARAVGDMLLLADPILRGGLAREESRGSHYREDFTERNDERFMATTVAEFDPATGRSKITFEPIEAKLVTPRKRTYGKKEQQVAAKVAADKPLQQLSPSPVTAANTAATAGV